MFFMHCSCDLGGLVFERRRLDTVATAGQLLHVGAYSVLQQLGVQVLVYLRATSLEA